MYDGKYIPTPEAARRFGLSREYAAKLAKESHQAGNSFPIKRGRSWQAPIEEWDRILNPAGKSRRKKRKLKVGEVKQEFINTNQKISCAEAARALGLSPSWGNRLTKRAVERNFEWPEWENGQWIAPLSEWKRIFSDPSLRAWMKKK